MRRNNRVAPLFKGISRSFPAGNARGSGSTPRRRLEMAVEVVPRLAAGRKCSVEPVPNRGAGCVKPWNRFQTVAQLRNALWKWFQTSAQAAQPFGSGFKPHFRASRPFGSSSTPISRLRHASRGILSGAAASLRTDARSCHKYSHFLAVSIQTG